MLVVILHISGFGELFAESIYKCSESLAMLLMMIPLLDDVIRYLNGHGLPIFLVSGKHRVYDRFLILCS